MIYPPLPQVLFFGFRSAKPRPGSLNLHEPICGRSTRCVANFLLKLHFLVERFV
jgi:hypothetical protein